MITGKITHPRSKFTFGEPKCQLKCVRAKTEQQTCSLDLKNNDDQSSSLVDRKLKCPRPKLKIPQQTKNASQWNFSSTTTEVQVRSTKVQVRSTEV